MLGLFQFHAQGRWMSWKCLHYQLSTGWGCPLEQTWLLPYTLFQSTLWGGLRVCRLGSLWRRLDWKMLSRTTPSASHISPWGQTAARLKCVLHGCHILRPECFALPIRSCLAA